MKNPIYQSVKRITVKLLALFLTPFTVFILLPCFLLVLVPFLIFRWIIFTSAPVLKPKLGKMLTAYSSLTAAESIYNSKKSPWNIVVALYVKGEVDIELFRKAVEEKLIKVKLSNGCLIYPELTQNIRPWMGYYFWKPVKNFKVSDHTYFSEDLQGNGNEPITEEQIQKYIDKLSQKPFTKNRAMWEFIVVSDFKPKNIDSQPNSIPRSVILFRLHHALADGMSIKKLIHRLMGKIDENEVYKHKSASAIKKIMRKLIFALILILKAPYELTYTFLTMRDTYEGKQVGKNISKAELIGVQAQPFSMNYFKQVRDLHRVGFNSLLLSIITGAYRDVVLKQGRIVPHRIGILMPVPLSGRSEKLRNLIGFVKISLPTGEPDPIKRLKMIHKKFEKTKTSTVLPVTALLGRFVGCLPYVLLKRLRSLISKGPSALLSNLPGSNTELNFLGTPVERITGGINFAVGSDMEMMFVLCSYNGTANLFIQTTSLFLPNELNKLTFVDSVAKHLDYYSKTEIV